MARIGIFGRTSGSSRFIIRALGDGVAAAGDRPVFQGPDAWKQYQATDEFDAIVVHGFSGKGQEIADCFRAWRRPVFVLEQGHIHRGQYHQLGVERINWLPDRAVGSCRRWLLDVNKPSNARAQDGYVLVLGQKPGDAQHEGVDVREYLTGKLDEIRRITRREIVYRAHPKDRSGWAPHGVVVHDPHEVFLDESFQGAHSVVTFNSNAGLLAILKGYPVFCEPRAPYAQACKTNIEAIEKQYNVPRERWERTLNRICYAQWNVDELASGEAWSFVRSGVLSEPVSV